MKLDILAFGAHPDDVELGCSGTIAKEISFGKKIGIIDLTRGELGTRGSVEIRNAESAKASEILGITVRENLDMRDGFFINDELHQIKIIEMIRKYKPEIVLCNAVRDRHIDHGKGSKLVSDACFLSGLRRIETATDGKNQETWRPKVVYHYLQDRYMEPDFIVDISDEMETRTKAQMAYSSQLFNPDSKEPQTVISSKQFFDSLSSRALEFGRTIGKSYGEGFVTERIPGIDNLFLLQ